MRSRKVSSSLSLHSSLPWFSSLQSLNQLLAAPSPYILKATWTWEEGKVHKAGILPLFTHCRKGQCQEEGYSWDYWQTPVGKHCEKQVTLKNLQFFSSQRLEGRQHQHYRGQTREMKSKFSCFKSGPSVRINMRRIGWMMDQLCRRAHLAFNNWFRNNLCTHNLFCHRVFLISSVLSNTFLRISILQNI